MAVLMHHVLEESQALDLPPITNPALIRMGAAGVDVFFVISGFIMMYTTWEHFGERGASWTFIKRRFMRILPLYWIAILLTLVLKYGVGLYRAKRIDAESLLASLALLPSLHQIVSVAWTLVYEMFFYYVFAVWLATGKHLQCAAGVISTFLLLLLFREYFGAGDLADFFSNPISMEFAFGIALGFAYGAGIRPTMRLPLALIVSFPLFFVFQGAVIMRPYSARAEC